MCGIAGFIDFNRKGNKEILGAMTHVLHHRGPDGEGQLLLDTPHAQVGLGHRRLSIIDLSSAASQPMEYDGLHIIFNGEIYNYREIRDELIQLGHNFKTHSDTEVILHGYRQWGVQSIRKWKGMFSLSIYDEKQQQMVCIRDRAGVKPFYYYWNNECFLFGSELKVFSAHPSFERKLSADAAALFFQYGYVPQPYAIYQHTYKLPPGHILIFNLAEKRIELEQFWNIYDHYKKPKLDISLDDAVTETEKILSQAFQYRMVADVPVGVFLSGGFDSSCVTALLQQNATEKIKTFTIGNADAKYNEAHHAKKVAAYLGTDHTEYYCTPNEAMDIIPQLPYFYDEPFADSSAIPSILVSRLASEKVTVALSADAGDEIFAGYNRYQYLLKYYQGLGKAPAPIRKAMAGVMEMVSSDDIPYFRKQYNFHSRYQKLKGLLPQSSLPDMMKSSVEVFNRKDIAELFSQSTAEVETSHKSTELDAADDALSYMLAVDFQTYLTDDILQKVDRATMSASLEGREPFLDQDIVEWVAQLPSSFKIHNGDKKYLLKQIVYRHLPAELMDRPKMGFSIPVENWMQKELKPLVEEYLSEEMLAHGLFNKKYVSRLKKDFFSGRLELHVKMWHLLMFQMWFHQWMKQ